jgi:hypothetical protein
LREILLGRLSFFGQRIRASRTFHNGKVTLGPNLRGNSFQKDP